MKANIPTAAVIHKSRVVGLVDRSPTPKRQYREVEGSSANFSGSCVSVYVRAPQFLSSVVLWYLYGVLCLLRVPFGFGRGQVHAFGAGMVDGLATRHTSYLTFRIWLKMFSKIAWPGEARVFSYCGDMVEPGHH